MKAHARVILFGGALSVMLRFGALAPVYGQTSFNASDSLYFGSVSNDTTKLRQVASDHLGQRDAAMARSRIGFLKFKGGNSIGAEMEFTGIREAYPQFPEAQEALYFLGRLASQRRDLDGARGYLSTYIKESADGYWREGAEYYLIAALHKQQDSSALPLMRQFLVDRPNAFYAKDVQYYVVDHYRRTGEYSKALAEARVMMQKYPESNYAKDFKYQIGNLQYLSRDYAGALAYYGNMATVEKRGTEPAAIGQFLMAELYDREGDYENAKTEYAKVASDHPAVNNWAILSEYSICQILYKQAATKMDSALVVKARNSLNQFISSHPTDKRAPRALMSLATLFRQCGYFTEALDALDRIVGFQENTMTNISPDAAVAELKAHRALVAQARMTRAVVLQSSLKQPDKALLEYNTILKDDTANVEALMGKALVLLALDRRDEARDMLICLAKGDGTTKDLALRYLTEYALLDPH